MKVPANLSGERLIREYLSRVTEAATRYLPKGRRIAFVGRTRNLIERECGPDGLADTARVREVLAGLGEPVDLVMAECARLDAERIKRQSRGKEAADADAAEVTAPLPFRPLDSRWRPATHGRSPRWQPPAGQGDAGQDRPAGRRGAAGDGKRKSWLGGLLVDWPPRKGAQPGAQPSREPEPRSPAGMAGQAPGGTAGQAPGGTASQAPGGAAGQAQGGTAGQAPGGTAAARHRAVRPAMNLEEPPGGHQTVRALRRPVGREPRRPAVWERRSWRGRSWGRDLVRIRVPPGPAGRGPRDPAGREPRRPAV